jgi:branched-chain amino acid transport system permease protein
VVRATARARPSRNRRRILGVITLLGPATFDLTVGIEFLLMAVIGADSSTLGALVGAAAITFLRVALQDFLSLVTARAGNIEIVVYDALFIAMLQYAPQGLVGLIASRPPRRAEETSLSALNLPRREQPAKGRKLLEVEKLTKRFGRLVAVEMSAFKSTQVRFSD